MRFRSLTDTPPESRIRFRFNGIEVDAVAGQTIAAALLAAGQLEFRRSTRTMGTDAMHGPWCLMGACFECVVEVRDAGRCQACMTEVREGMDVTAA